MKRPVFNTKFLASLAGLFTIASTVFALNAGISIASAKIDNTPDYDNVAIIRGGVSSTSDAKTKCKANKTGDLDNIYKAFGFDCSDISGMKSGVVYRNGDVKVDGKVVATDAMTAGRNYGGSHISGTKNVGKYSTSKFVDDGQTALVKLDKDGKFLFAIVKPCGNPVSAKPKETPKPKPKPSYSCDSLEARKLSRTKFEFTAEGSAKNGAKITGYRFTFGDGTSATISSNTTTHTYSTAGSYSVTVEIRVSVDGSTKYVDGNNCETTITVTPPPAPEKVEVCNPETGEIITVDKKDQDNYKPVGDEACESLKVCRLSDHKIVTIKGSDFDESKYSKNLADCQEQPVPEVLPSTGPTEFITGGLGLGSLTAAGYYFRASRRTLLSKFMKR